MPRLKDTVQESLKEIEQLERDYAGEPQAVRLRMLRLLKEDPSRTLGETAELVGRSERSVQRWWEAYTTGGIEAMLEVRKPGGIKPTRIGQQELEAFHQKSQTDGFSGLKEAQQWLHDRFGVQYSRTGVWNLMQSASNTEPAVASGEVVAHPTVRTSVEAAAGAIPQPIIAFLNALPITGEAVDWINAFREELRILLGDVDRISVYVNMECDLREPEQYEPNVAIVQHTDSDRVGGPITVTSHDATRSRADRLLDDFRRQGFPLEKYHPPFYFDYFYGGHAYLGTIFLWREIGKKPISQQTVATVASLESFLIFALSDLVTRHQYRKPIDRVFYDAFETLAEEAGLSPQERRVIVLQLLGHSYDRNGGEFEFHEFALCSH